MHNKDKPKQRVRAKPTVVGIGASAGGLAALRTFFSHVPSDSGLAFVVVVHLSPDHESHLADLLQPYVRMPVRQVTETMQLEPNQVYVIPPNANLNAVDTHLRLSELEERRRERAPIDHFLRTLASTHDGSAIAVILSGTGSDGTLGINDVKAKGGLIVVQDPNEAEYDGMPQSAIGTGLTDFILPLAEMPAALLRFARTTPNVVILPDEDKLQKEEAQLLSKVLAQLRARTERDFSRYNRSTIFRRIARRMQLNYLEDLEAYINKLREHPEEVLALADDLLINVTSFFRDPKAFEKLEKDVIPRLFEGKAPEDAVRVWSVGCATGEEAYSLAMLLVEAAARLDDPPRIQVFASDLHKHSLDKAREGFYVGDIETVVDANRLKRFFHKENGGYRVQKEIRDLVVFAPHNLLGDPPFSKLALISCRNLLIYLQRDAQRDVIELFHYALNSSGFLILGAAETIDATELFRPEDTALRLYSKRNVRALDLRLPVFPLTRLLREAEPKKECASEPIVYRTLLQRTLERYAPPSLLISPDDKLAHLSGGAGRYLIHPSGDLTSNIFKLLREELRFELHGVLRSVREQKRPLDAKPTLVSFDKEPTPVVMRVRPVVEPGYDGFAVVTFEEGLEPVRSRAARPENTAEQVDPGEGHIAELEAELNDSRQRLQAVIEEYDTGQEEMKAANEEMQSTNEELRSTMEELETSKEELQSINEELQAVNQENRHRVEELAQLSSDLQNLFAATDIASLFLDRNLRIRRFTPKVTELFNIRPSDRGRPILDLTHHLRYDELREDVEAVLKRLIPVEREVLDETDRWYLTRVLPYRSSEDRIEGAVITFVDITARRRSEETLRSSEERLSRMINIDGVGVAILNESGKLVDSNDAFLEMCGYRREEVASGTLLWLDLTPPEHGEASECLVEQLERTGRSGPYEKQYLRKDGSQSWMVCAGASLGDGTIVEYCIDVLDRKLVEQELNDAKIYAESILETLHEPLLVLHPDLRVKSANPAFYGSFHVRPEKTIGRRIYDLGNGQWSIPGLRRLLENVLPDSNVFDNYEVEHDFEGIGRRVMLVNARRLDHVQLILLGVRDITKQREAEESLSRLNETLEDRVDQRTAEVRELSSRLTMAEHKERDRIAQVLHDDLQQLLYSVRMKLMFLRETLEEGSVEKSIPRVVQADEELVEGIQIVQRLSIDLSPQVLKQEGLREMLAWLADQMKQQHQLDVELRADAGFPAPLPLRVLLFQAVRELLFNVVKHAGVKQATVELRQDDGALLICVRDQGKGFDAAAQERRDGFGMGSLRHRLSLIGGGMDISSRPGGGTTVTLDLPPKLLEEEKA